MRLKRWPLMLLSCALFWLMALFWLTAPFFSSAYAVVDSYEFTSVVEEQRFYDLTNDLRCPKCQNQSVADSNAPIAQDLRREVYRMMVEEGAENQQVIDFMLARYGDFVLYTPKLEKKTWVLWFGPGLLLLIGLLVLMWILWSHQPKKKHQPKKSHQRKKQGYGESEPEELTPQQQAIINKIMDGKQS